GLRLDGIAMDAANIAPGYSQGAALVVADFANAGLPLGNRSAMSAGEAAHAIAVELFVQLAFADVFVDDVAEGGQRDLGKTVIYSVNLYPASQKLQCQAGAGSRTVPSCGC